jgi:hypothetical protein
MAKPNPAAALDRAMQTTDLFTNAVRGAMSKSTLHAYRSGDRPARGYHALVIQAALDIPAEDWLEDEKRRTLAQIRAAKGADNVR